jgi:hypothetical protein
VEISRDTLHETIRLLELGSVTLQEAALGRFPSPEEQAAIAHSLSQQADLLLEVEVRWYAARQRTRESGHEL